VLLLLKAHQGVPFDHQEITIRVIVIGIVSECYFEATRTCYCYQKDIREHFGSHFEMNISVVIVKV